jgi:hypothetical protein
VTIHIELKKNGLAGQLNFDYKPWGALPIIVRVMYRVGCSFDKSDHLKTIASSLSYAQQVILCVI